MTTEREVAQQIVHRERIAQVLSRTGGEIIHPDHYDLREAIRLAVLKAIDSVSAEHDLPKMRDGELPTLFRALDPIAECLFLKSKGL